MASRHLSLRVDERTLEKLERESARMGRNKSEVAKTLLEEGLRMAAHPGIVFRPGPTGRRAALANGPDVWEVIQMYQGFKDRAEPERELSELSSISPYQLRLALRYYAEYPVEIDARIELNDDEWAREQDLLAG